MEEEKEEDTEKLRIVFLLRRTQKYLFHQKVPAPSTPTPSPRSPICRRLSFKMNLSRNSNLRRRRRRRPEALLSFLKSRIHQSVGFQAQSSQDYLSCPPATAPQGRGRRQFQTSMRS